MSDRAFATWKLLDLVTGDAHEWLSKQRNAGLTYDEIVMLLMSECDLKVSREWVRKQCVRLAITAA